MPATRPKEFDPDAALGGAVEVFRGRGFAAATLPTLLADLGIARQSLYDTFGDKRALFCAALGRYSRDRLEALENRLAAPGPPLAAVRGWVESWPRRDDGGGCLVCNTLAELGGRDDAVDALLAAHVGRYRALVTGALARAAAEGELDPAADPGSLAGGLVAVRFGRSLLDRLPGAAAHKAAASAAALALLDAASRESAGGADDFVASLASHVDQTPDEATR